MVTGYESKPKPALQRNIALKPISPDAGPHLVTGCRKGFGEGKEGQGQVEETILVGVKLSVPVHHFIQLQTHKANHSCCGRGNGWDDLPCNQLAL